VTIRHNGFPLRPEFDGSDQADWPPYIEAKFENGEAWQCDLGGMSLDEIETAITTGKADRKGIFTIHGNAEELRAIMNRMIGKHKFSSIGDVKKIEERSHVVQMEISGTISMENIRAMALIGFKALLHAQYESKMLSNLAYFVRWGLFTQNFSYKVDAIPPAKGFTTTISIKREQVSHIVEWEVDLSETRLAVVLFKNRGLSVRLRLNIPHDQKRKIAAPGHIPGAGRLVARYYPTSGGWVEWWSNGSLYFTSKKRKK
jgi:hypothetical protein